ncbi:MAG: signal peptidase II [Betaproteobacteria bacterium]|jgi:signal peptidase II
MTHSTNQSGGRLTWLRWLWISVVVVAVDLSTKYYFDTTFTYGETRYVTPFFNWVLVYNPGAAFSFLANAGGWQREFFIVVTLVITSGLLWLLKSNEYNRLLGGAISLIIGGALGNLFDRVVHGHVIDFIQLHVAGYYWPAFNVADSAICIGAGLLVWDAIRQPNGKQKEGQAS